jgi:RHS repeat-associated protein
VTFGYDLNGNLQAKNDLVAGTTLTLTHDVLDQVSQAVLTGSPAESYLYGPSGKRLNKTVGATTTNYIYNGPDIHGEYDNAWSSQALFTHGPGMDDPILRDAGGATSFYHQDGLGSVVGTSDIAGATLATQRYDAWGNTLVAGNIPQYGYTGREPDATGLIYYRARYYDQQTGRFAQRDPVGFAGGDINLYTYVGGNPVNAKDPDGEIINFLVGAGTSVVVGGIIRGLTGGNVFDAKAIAADAALGAVGVGVVSKISKLNKLRNFNNLETIAQNRLVGEAAETIATRQISAGGNNLLGNQVSVRTSEGLRRLDNLVQTPSGQLINIEVKSGNAVRNASQLSKDSILASNGGTLVGRNAPDALRNTTQIIGTQELNISRNAAIGLLTQPGTLSTGLGGGLLGGIPNFFLQNPFGK